MKKSTIVTKRRAPRTALERRAARLAAIVGAEPLGEDPYNGRGGILVEMPDTEETGGCFVVWPDSLNLDVRLTPAQGEAALRAIGRLGRRRRLEKERLHMLANRLAETSDGAERARIKRELARMIFGG